MVTRMVAPHPDLMRKIRNTRRVIKERKQHLIPGLVRQLPDQYIQLENLNVFETLKPWVEHRRPKVKNISGHGIKPHSLQQQPPVHDRIIVLCVSFPDKAPMININDITTRFFGSGKSLRNYYIENSYGKYVPEGEVHGWYVAPQPYSYYVNNQNGMGSYPNNTQKLVEDVINIAVTDSSINWDSFDLDDDRIIDHLFIVHTGAEGASSGQISDIWAHFWGINPLTRLGYEFRYYAITSEFMNFFFDPQRCGVDCHEWGHDLGLPDLYDYSGECNGIGNYSIMSHGNWVDSGFTPTHLDAWSKNQLGFTSTLVNQSSLQILEDAETHDRNHKFTTQHPNEYFLMENRQNMGFDKYLPGNGILIYKINENVENNNNELCLKVALMQADGRKDLENAVNYGDASDPYPGSMNNRALNTTTNPSNVLCDGSLSAISISKISDSDTLMYFISDVCIAPEVTFYV